MAEISHAPKVKVYRRFAWALSPVLFANVPAEHARQVAAQAPGGLTGGFCRPGGQMEQPAQIAKRRTCETEGDGAEIGTQVGLVASGLSQPDANHAFDRAGRILREAPIVRIAIINNRVSARPDPRSALLDVEKHTSHPAIPPNQDSPFIPAQPYG